MDCITGRSESAVASSPATLLMRPLRIRLPRSSSTNIVCIRSARASASRTISSKGRPASIISPIASACSTSPADALLESTTWMRFSGLRSSTMSRASIAALYEPLSLLDSVTTMLASACSMCAAYSSGEGQDERVP